MKKMLILIMTVILISGCNEKSREEGVFSQSAPEKIILEGDDITLSTVNGTNISKYDLDFAIKKLVPKNRIEVLTLEDRKKIIESLASSRALSIAEENLMTKKDQKILEKEVAYFREELLVKKYITRKAKLEKVPDEEILAFYNKHPEKFGGKIIKNFELIKSTRELKVAERDAMVEKLKKPFPESNWTKWAQELKNRGCPIEYGKGDISSILLNPRLRDIMESLNPGDASNVIFIKGVLYLVKIEKERVVHPRPFLEVKDQIRKMLSPVMLKKELKKISGQVKQNTEIKYFNEYRD